MRKNTIILSGIALAMATQIVNAQVRINEFVYDDGGTDDREFVELYNAGIASVDISNWTLGGRDFTGLNTIITIPASTTIAPGGFYVVGMTGVPNVNLTNASFLENDAETIELRDGPFATGVLQDAVLFESNKGTTSYGTLPTDVAALVGANPGFWGNNQTSDSTVTGLTRNSLSRWRDGINSNNNGRNFGLRLPTPGASNTTPGFSNTYVAPNVDALNDADEVVGFGYAFTPPRVITPGVVSGFNPNVIPAAPGFAKAIVAWDSTGGANATSFGETMSGGGSFLVRAYLDTNDLPVSTNAAALAFRGSEISIFGIGSADALNGLTDISGNVGLLTVVSANGITGLAWVYEKVGLPVSGTGVSERLYLVDAGDGGNSNINGTGGQQWTILQDIDLSSSASGWFDLGITVDAAGNGVATFNGVSYIFSTIAGLDGAFSVGYRENTQAGAVTVPSYLRPPTFTAIPEPTTLGLLAAASVMVLRRKRA